MNTHLKLMFGLVLSLSAAQAFSTVPTIKQKLEKEGFSFVKQIEAPAQMTGWAGHMQQNPATVFISNDQKYSSLVTYIMPKEITLLLMP